MASAVEPKPDIHDANTVRNNEAVNAEKKDASTSDNDTHHAEDPSGLATSEDDRKHYEKYGTYDRYEITEEDCYDELGFSFPTWKKWSILGVIFLVQVSMNFNTSLYSNAVTGISHEFGVSAQAARVGAAIFLITYAFGCELWAPWSEELGRWPILQLSMFFVNIWQIPVGIAPNFATIIVCRALGGISTAGGSVTLAIVADLFEPDNQQYAVAFIVFSSVGGSIFGPIVGGFVEQFLAWRWNIWIQLIFGCAVQLAHIILVPETRTTVMMDRIAKKRRTAGDKDGKPVNIWGPNELKTFKERFSAREIMITWTRPFRMFLTEPIVLVLSLLSGFSDAIIFMFLQSYALVYKQWDFAAFSIGLAFIPIGIGYLLAWFSFFPAIKRNYRLRRERPGDEQANYEARLWWLLFTAPCLPIGLIIFAWTSTGPPIHWMGSLVGSAIIGIANYAIYMATIDYMICAYGPYSASATGGNGWARDFLAGVLTLPATPFYQNIGGSGGKFHLAYASTILFAISLLLVVSVYVIYWKGPELRKRSPFAQQLNTAREETGGRRVSSLPGLYGSRANSLVGDGSVPGTRRGSVIRGQSYQGSQGAPPAVRERLPRGNSAARV
ncbi:MFS general substrate transporter [Cucurbitaria berberidis CBS 394.84]|uniref:MFS general substrate transporter n=1 Tax=Cucurbitaria berberidis CBS 394.84 TaxID=1168544 RepID=A0A9P4LB80_9PLEO|nr:MFS general substrate transporter [Cucurbitaria berberidis CBS 394.84]KAF1848795.1 MFS general substrate transporter [Cucurbitaria berberidis CBS 394.84]